MRLNDNVLRVVIMEKPKGGHVSPFPPPDGRLRRGRSNAISRQGESAGAYQLLNFTTPRSRVLLRPFTLADEQT
jgi:hypothetical protein